jgi:hypothetical protein
MIVVHKNFGHLTADRRRLKGKPRRRQLNSSMGTLRLVDDCDMLPSGQLCVWTALHALGRLKERKGSLKECFEHSIPPLTKYVSRNTEEGAMQ